MGEIADALRRARGQRAPETEESEFAPPSLQDVIESTEDVAATPELAANGTAIETVRPHNPVVIPQDGPHAEVCRQVALRLRDALEARDARSVAVVSGERGDGKTTVACNLAVAMASLSRDRSVAIVDLDLRRPSLASYLNLDAQVGIEQVLLGKAKLEDVRIGVGEPAIDLYPALEPQRDAHKLIVLPALAEMLEQLERNYATVIVDTPPTPVVPDANLLLRHVRCCVPVVRHGKTRARSVRRLVEGLHARHIAGWVLNGDRSAHYRDQDYYYYGERDEDGS